MRAKLPTAARYRAIAARPPLIRPRAGPRPPSPKGEGVPKSARDHIHRHVEDLGNLQNQDTTDIGLNIIYGNGNTGVIYDLYNNTPDSIKAENNYWGTMNPDSVEAHIFHKPDNPALGFVDYLPLGLPTGIIKNHISVTGYEMLEIYPNPFNPEVIIKFRINTAGAINLKIYDLLGREVRTLLNNNLSPGEYEQTWNPTGLSSGVYIIRLATKENTFSQMISFVM